MSNGHLIKGTLAGRPYEMSCEEFTQRLAYERDELRQRAEIAEAELAKTTAAWASAADDRDKYSGQLKAVEIDRNSERDRAESNWQSLERVKGKWEKTCAAYRSLEAERDRYKLHADQQQQRAESLQDSLLKEMCAKDLLESEISSLKSERNMLRSTAARADELCCTEEKEPEVER